MTFLARFSYYVNDVPKNGCAPGMGVSDKDECKEACEHLEITVPNGNWQNDGNPCLAISKTTYNRAIASEIRLTGFANKRVKSYV